jgi:DNA-binding response OmpR family regulator
VAPIEGKTVRRVLLVDDDREMLDMMNQGLELRGFEVVCAASVTEALRCIATESFDVLITDLHMPNPGDGFTVISAMRHSHPKALTLLVSGYPDVQSAMSAILLEADEIVVKPLELGRLADLVTNKLLGRRPAAGLEKERVGKILHRCIGSIVGDWLVRAKLSEKLNHLMLSDSERTGHLPKLVEDVTVRLSNPSSGMQGSDSSGGYDAALAHGRLRYQQGYTAAMLVHKSRILQVAIFGTLQNNLNALDFSLLLPDVMIIADEVDAQLTQTMTSFMDCLNPKAA